MAKKKGTKKRTAMNVRRLRAQPAALGVREPHEVLTDLALRHPQHRGTKRLKKLGGLVPADYTAALSRVGECEIACDFIFLGPARSTEENALRNAPKAGLGDAWWLFAVSGTGDGWLVRSTPDGSEVAFLDHDREASAKPAPLGIDFGQWLQLADLMAQSEARDAFPWPNRPQEVRRQIDSICKGLARRYPYAV